MPLGPHLYQLLNLVTFGVDISIRGALCPEHDNFIMAAADGSLLRFQDSATNYQMSAKSRNSRRSY